MSANEEEAKETEDINGLSDDDSLAGDLQSFVEDVTKVESDDKVQYVINLCHYYVKDFSTNSHPYNHKSFKNQKKLHKISNTMLKKEIKRRDPSIKLSNKKQPEMLSLLRSDDYLLPPKDMSYLLRQKHEYEKLCQLKIDERERQQNPEADEASERTNITIDDRLRLIEAFFSDEAKPKMWKTQESLSREELDARNSVLAVEDYFETVSNVFNDPGWMPTLATYPDLHPELATSRDLPLLDYRTTRAKVKDKYNEMKNHLHGVIIRYERSGNGGMQRSDESPDWGRFGLDPENVVAGDDRKTYLPKDRYNQPNQNLYYLLYFWQKLDEEGAVQFTLAKLPKSMKADSDNFALVSPSMKRKESNDKSRRILASAVQSVGTAIATHAVSSATQVVASINRDLNNFQNQLLSVQLKLHELEEGTPIYNIYKQREEALLEMIDDVKNTKDDAIQTKENADKKLKTG